MEKVLKGVSRSCIISYNLHKAIIVSEIFFVRLIIMKTAGQTEGQYYRQKDSIIDRRT